MHDRRGGEAKRYSFFDFGRGILMILMALDHASKFYNVHRVMDEGLQGHFPSYRDTPQVITRLLGNIAAPGFIFTFGTMVAVSSIRRTQRGENQWAISSHLIKRGLFLIFLQFAVISRLTVTFGILYCIGCLMILLAFLRRVPSMALVALSICSATVIPYLSYTVYSSKKWVQFLLAATLTPSRHGLYPFLPWNGLYPFLTWLGVAGFGYWFGTYFVKKWTTLDSRQLAGKFAILSAALTGLFGAIRVANGFGNLYIWKQFSFGEFFLMSKYPPSVTFLLWNTGLYFGIIAADVIINYALKDNSAVWRYLSRVWRSFSEVIELYGRTPLFFYVVHLYLYETIADVFSIHSTLSLPLTWLMCLIGLIALYPLCLWFYRLKVRYPNNAILRML